MSVYRLVFKTSVVPYSARSLVKSDLISESSLHPLACPFKKSKVTNNAFPQRKPLQTGFLAGMEWCLGVRDHVQLSKTKQWDETEHPRYDAREADALMEAEGNDPGRLRYRKMFWEAVPDGKACPVSSIHTIQ